MRCLFLIFLLNFFNNFLCVNNIESVTRIITKIRYRKTSRDTSGCYTRYLNISSLREVLGSKEMNESLYSLGYVSGIGSLNEEIAKKFMDDLFNVVSKKGCNLIPLEKKWCWNGESVHLIEHENKKDFRENFDILCENLKKLIEKYGIAKRDFINSFHVSYKGEDAIHPCSINTEFLYNKCLMEL